MIGVTGEERQTAVIREFFQLFKTPWEFCRPGKTYEVVVATAEPAPTVGTRLLVRYGGGDGETSRRGAGLLEYGEVRLPIYGPLRTFPAAEGATVCVAADTRETVGVRTRRPDLAVVRLGYDLFDEVAWLLAAGQPPDRADIPTLDLHIMILRSLILEAGIGLIEIPPVPAAHQLTACLTHDIDFAGARFHRFDYTMWGFLQRATLGSIRKLCRGRASAGQVFANWCAAASLPLVWLGWARDFWEPFPWYLRVEQHRPATYFLIPFKGQPGNDVPGRHAARRAAAYDLDDLAPWTSTLRAAGCELAVHGIDAWRSVEQGRRELRRLAAVSGEARMGIRMHWLLGDADTPQRLAEAGYEYDASAGFNETIGYRCGTAQVFGPPGAGTLLELPLLIQDGALFFPDRLDLTESEAWARCEELIGQVSDLGGVLTVLWHDRSHGPERFWGDFYVRLVQALAARGAWFATAGEVVGWFRKRRGVDFAQVEMADGTVRYHLRSAEGEIVPPVRLRIHRPLAEGHTPGTSGARDWTATDVAWDGRRHVDLDDLLETACLEASARP